MLARSARHQAASDLVIGEGGCSAQTLGWQSCCYRCSTEFRRLHNARCGTGVNGGAVKTVGLGRDLCNGAAQAVAGYEERVWVCAERENRSVALHLRDEIYSLLKLRIPGTRCNR